MRAAAPAAVSALAACAVALMLLAAGAQAAPVQLWQACGPGGAAGQCARPLGGGIAANPRNGHVYVGDRETSGIDEFDSLGQFVKAWGWGVVASGPGDKPRNEIQEVTVDATGGDFELKVAFLQTTEPIPFDASATDLQAALEALPNHGNDGELTVNPGDIVVSGPPGGPWAIEFTGANADADISQLEVVNSTLSGAGAGATVTTTQPGANFEICVPEDGDVCRSGQEGSAAGQFGSSSPQGLALDSAGNLFVVDGGLPSNQRVQKFSPSGQFLAMFGGEVNKTKTEEVGSTEAQRNLCVTGSGDVCQKGSEGAGDGEFGKWAFGSFIAIDTNGTATAADDDVYVGDENRIQVFDSGGAYQRQFAVAGTVQSLAVDSAGNLYASYQEKPGVHKLSPTGVPLGPETFEIPKLTPSETPVPTAVAVDPEGHVFVFGPTGCNVFSGCTRAPIFEFDSAGKVIDEFGKGEFVASTGLATNLCAGSEPPGNLYVTNVSNSNEGKALLRAYGSAPSGCLNIETGTADGIEEALATVHGAVNPRGAPVEECLFQYGLGTAYGQTAPCAESSAQIGTGNAFVGVHAEIGSLAKATIYHYRLLARIGGTLEKGADKTFKTLGPPVISAEQVLSTAYTEASLKALINPEGIPTTYRFQYTTQASFEADGFSGAQSSTPIAVGSDRNEHPAVANLEGLTPGITYAWRVLAANSSGETEGQPHTFVTYRQPLAETDCTNQAFRNAAAAFLPDCRAYEMVSPLDKNGADIVSALSGVGNAGGYVQASPDGERITYSALFASFAGEPTSFKFNQYLAARGADGWSTEGIHPPMPGHWIEGLGLYPLVRNFSAFSPDLCNAWLWDAQTPPLEADAQAGYPNLYRRQNCGAGAGQLETLTSAPLSADTKDSYATPHSVQGVSDDSRHAVFVVKAKLTPEASDALNSNTQAIEPIAQVYDRFEGANHLVSVLPGGEANSTNAVVGSGPTGVTIGGGNLANAVSADGSRVYWAADVSDDNGLGKIYLRQHPEQGIVPDECADATTACTLPVSAGAKAFFWAAAGDGSKALYGEGVQESEDLFEFDLKKAEEGEPPRLIAHNVNGLAGTSADLSRIYFVSKDALPGSGAQAGKPNLYLDEEGTKVFVATLIAGDVEEEFEPGLIENGYNDAALDSYNRSTRVSTDGSRIVFESRAPLTGYDNADADSGKPAVEVFTYQAGGALACISCNPSGARPSGVRELRIPYRPPFELNNLTKVPAAAWIPTWEHKLHASNVLSADGNRLFFNANDALVPRDTNGAPDVYQWEAAGTGGCTEASSSFFPQNGGCLDLISSGESPGESEFWEASPDGKNVFFTTPSSLVPQDPGLIDLYDARVGGGFPQPVEVSACEGEACQGPSQAPNDPTPASAGFRGPGSPKAAKKTKARGCPKGKRVVRRKGKGKARCVPKRQKDKQRAGNKRRAAR